MRKKKLLTAVISLALVISMVLPGTLAVSNGQDSSDTPAETTASAVDPAPDAGKTGGAAAENGEAKTEAGSTGNQTPAQNENTTGTTGGETGAAQPAQGTLCDECGQSDGTHLETCSHYVKAEEKPAQGENQPGTGGTTETPDQPSGNPENPENPEQQPEEEKKCTCGVVEGEAHKEGCPLYKAPECTCGAAEGEAHKEGCPLYEAPEAEDYTDLFNRFLATQTYEEFDAIYQSLSEEDRAAFTAWLTENGKMEALQAHFSELYIVNEPRQEEPIVPFTNAGPLLAAPVARPRMRRAARNAKDNSGIVLNKTAVANSDGTYTITLEAYATGETTTTVTQQPVDIVLVLDVSGSMSDPFQGGGYSPVYASSLDTSKTYYILNYWGNYKEVKWNAEKEQWEHYVEYWLGGGYWASYEPRTSSSDNNRDHTQFYTYVASQSKMDALKTAVNGFIDSVAAQSPTSNIAIVKFAGNKRDRVGNDDYRDGYFTYNYSQIVRNLTAAGTGADGLKTAVNALSPAGATRADFGMEHAQTIISSVANDGNKKVVIMFTDGQPTDNSEFEYGVANAAISASKSVKDAGATVYTIGVFSGANGTPVTSWNGVSDTNKYMHLVSSNYKNATAMRDSGAATYPASNKSYFLTPSGAGELNAIFQSISQEIGGATTTLDETATIRDIVSPYFTMPADATDVTVKTAESDGSTGKWKAAVDFNGTVSIDAPSSTVSVSGFSFKDNWCGNQTKDNKTTFHDGKKLIIQFTVSPKEGFLGGNDVPTNGSDSGIYDEIGVVVKKFDLPAVNVPIKDVTVTAADKNVYLLGTVTANEIKSGATAKVGDVELKLGESNYGLAAWQTEHVRINVKYTDANGNEVTDLNDLKADTTYTVTVKVTPKELDPESKQGEKATEKTGSGTGNINVFKPELTYKDSTAYYGETVAADFSGNRVSEVWKHGETASMGVTMIGDKPALDISYAPDSARIYGGKYGKRDVPVKAIVKIGEEDVNEHTAFAHQDCTPACGWTAPAAKGDPAFLVHIQTCALMISKDGGAADETYVFNVYKDGVKYSEVTIWGNGAETLRELPVGTYTVEEDEGWSWRYTANNGSAVALSRNASFGAITCVNTKVIDKWLNGFSGIARNIIGAAKN